MTIKRVEGIRYGVEDMPECIEFLEHWGLEKLESGETGAEFKTPENQTISLRLKTDPVLPPTNEDGPTAKRNYLGCGHEGGFEPAWPRTRH